MYCSANASTGAGCYQYHEQEEPTDEHRLILEFSGEGTSKLVDGTSEGLDADTIMQRVFGLYSESILYNKPVDEVKECFIKFDNLGSGKKAFIMKDEEGVLFDSCWLYTKSG